MELLGLLETVSHSDNQDVVFRTFLSACSDQQVFINKAPSVVQPVLATINSKLNSSASRFEGLLLLKTYLPQCSADIFGDNAISWMKQCLKTGETGENKHEVINTTYQVLHMLLKMSEDFPEMKRSITSMIIPKIIENFQHINLKEVSLPALECIELLMLYFGPSCGQQKNIVESSILQYIDCKDNDIIKRVARCVAYLPLLGGGGSFGVNHVSRWNQDHQKLCATLHSILTELFDDIREVPNSYSCMASENLVLPPITDSSSLLRVYHLVTRFINVTKCLQEMLVSEFPVEKRILPDAIIGLVCRGLAVNSRSLGKKASTSVLMTGAMLPQIHIALLRLLDSLIACCRRNLLPYSSVICRLVLQTLKWTSEENWVYGVEKPFGHLREAAYNTLMLWLQVSNSGSCVELIADQLVLLMMQDIWFEKEAVTLVGHKNTKDNKKRQKGSNEMNGRILRKHLPAKTANSSVCRAALQLLQWVLHSSGPFVKPVIHRILQEKTVKLLFDIQRTGKSQDLPAPFSESLCRLELYQLLYTLLLEPHSVWPPPTQFALHILSAGRNDLNLQVSGFCTRALAAIEKVIHPPSSTLQFPVPLEEMLESTRKSIQQNFAISVNEHSDASQMDSSSIRIEPGSIRTEAMEEVKESEEPIEVTAELEPERAYDERINDEDREESGSELYDDELNSDNEVTVVSSGDEQVPVLKQPVVKEQKRVMFKGLPRQHEMDDNEEEEFDEDEELDEEDLEEEEDEDLDEDMMEDEEEDGEAPLVDLADSEGDDGYVNNIDHGVAKRMNNCTAPQERNKISKSAPPEIKVQNFHGKDKFGRDIDPLSGVGTVNENNDRAVGRYSRETKVPEICGENNIGKIKVAQEFAQPECYSDEEVEDEDENENDIEEPNNKKIKLDSVEGSVKMNSKVHEITDGTEEVITDEPTEQPVNGVETEIDEEEEEEEVVEEVTEEEMLQSFVDAVAE